MACSGWKALLPFFRPLIVMGRQPPKTPVLTVLHLPAFYSHIIVLQIIIGVEEKQFYYIQSVI